MNPNEKKVEPKDVFLHLLSIAMLYASAISFLAVVFQSVNIALPDALNYYGGDVYRFGPLRFAIATLVIVFPVFFFATRSLKKMYSVIPEKSELRARKWLVYFTLFVAALVLVGDLVAVLNGFLGGELTLRFIIKALAVFFVAGAIFGYYLMQLRGAQTPSLKIFTRGIPVVVLGVIIMGFSFAGSPMSQRNLQFDMRRVNDLQYLQSQVEDHWVRTRNLPATLEVLQDPLRGISIPKDPETNSDYEYAVTSGTAMPTFSLCAVFTLPSDTELDAKLSATSYYPGSPENFWTHGSGRTCFTRTINPELYKNDSRLAPALK